MENILGDIIRIRNSSGTIVANYSYDAWGNIISKSGTMADINPFRYRGYYYDNETGFYYLQTRYYDPSIRMFINADNYELIGQLSCVAGQLNLYAYANNNPIMLTDESGEGILLAIILGAIIGATIGGVAAYNIASSNGATGWELVGRTALGAIGGGLLGGLLGGGIVYAVPSISAFMSSSFSFGNGALAVSLSGTQIIASAGAATTLGFGLVFSKGNGSRLGHNHHENEQFESAMKEIGGYKKTDYQWRKAHDALIKHKKKGNYISEYKDLIKFIKNVLGV